MEVAVAESKHAGPVVVIRADALAQADGERLDVRIGVHDDLREILVHLGVQLAGVNAGLHLDAEALLAVLLVGDHDVDILGDLGHDLDRLLAPLPQLLAVVEVAGDRDALLLALLQRFDGRVAERLGQRGRDAGDVEPVCIREDRIPVKIAGLHRGDRRVVTVVDDLGGAHVRAGLREVEAEALVGEPNGARVQTEAAQLVDGCTAEIVLRQRRDELRLVAVCADSNRDVGLRAAEGADHVRRLQNHFSAGRGDTEHQLTKSNNFFHFCLPR